MKKILNISFFGIVLLMLVAVGCKEKPLPEANVEAKVWNVNVPSPIYAQVPYVFSATDLTGATYTWSVIGVVDSNGTVVDADYAQTCEIVYPYDYTSSTVEITFGAVDSAVDVQVIVLEEIAGTSDADTLTVTVNPFCPPTGFDLFNGTDVTATDTLGTDFNGSKPVCSISTDDAGNALIVLDGALAATFRGWDDNGTPELHDTIPVTLYLNNPGFTGPKSMLYAHTVEGGDNWYYYFEDIYGTYDNCGDNISILIKYKVHYVSEDADADGYFSHGAHFWTQFYIVNGKVVSVESNFNLPQFMSIDK